MKKTFLLLAATPLLLGGLAVAAPAAPAGPGVYYHAAVFYKSGPAGPGVYYHA